MSSPGSKVPSPFVHRLNLNVVGGVEVSFLQYARHRQACGAADTVIVGEGTHPRFAPAVASPMRAVRRNDFKRWYGMRLPKSARRLRARVGARIAAAGDEQAVIGWDSIGNREIMDIARAARLPLLHYEHGQAWRPEVRHAASFFAYTGGVIANSHAAERILALRWGWQGPTERVYCTVDSVLPPESARPGLARERPLWLGSAARMVEVKGHRIALHALKVLRDEHRVDARLAIAGTGEGEQALRAETARLGLDGAVQFKGAVTDMAGFYDQIDILLMPSLQESFGRTSIEAQARGCPAIVAAINGLPETLAPDAPAATSIVPELSLADYGREIGGDVSAVWPWVYDPQTDELAQPRAVAPDRLAEAVCALTQGDGVYHQASRGGLANVHARFMPAGYGPAVDTAIQRLLGGPDARRQEHS